MNSYLPYADFTETAKTLDLGRLIRCYIHALVILRSLAHVYPIKPGRTYSGYENHTVGKFWKGYELQLARYFNALAKEIADRPLPKTADKAISFKRRKTNMELSTALVEFLEDQGYPDTKPVLIGDKTFHSGMRALLLYRDIQAVTFKNWKQGLYPDHVTTRKLMPSKKSWRKPDFEHLWEIFGRPEPAYYGQFNWTEEPDDTKMFYATDRVPQMLKEEQRKTEKPYLPFYNKNRAGAQN